MDTWPDKKGAADHDASLAFSGGFGASGIDRGSRRFSPQSHRQDINTRLNCTKFVQLILRKITKIVATKSHI